jgi:serine/threonine-protein kinase
MSPEQVRGGALDGRGDLFSLGVVLHEMLTGEKPFGGESVSSVLYRIVNEDAADPSAERPSLPPGLAGFLGKALAKDPGDRFPDGDAFAAALRRAAREGGGRVEAVEVPPSRPSAPQGNCAAAPGRLDGPRPGRRRIVAILGAAGAVLAVTAGAYVVFRGFPGAPPAPAVVWLESRVRTEPPGIPVLLDQKPMAGDRVRFSSAGPFGRIVAAQDCRRAEHTLAPEDAGREIVLVLDPVRTAVPVDPGVAGARVRLNGAAALAAPTRLELDLCRSNIVEASSPGHRTARVTIPPGATPLEARTAAAGLRLAAIPKGKLKLPSTPYPVTFLVDGRRVGRAEGTVELLEGVHQVRAVDEERWIDVRSDAEIKAGETTTPRLRIPEMAVLTVQAYPGNCKVYLKRAGGEWRFLDDAPVRREVAAGRYRVKVESEATSESKEQDVALAAGQDNPPLRFGFEKGKKR